MNRVLNWIPDRPDHRDLRYMPIKNQKLGALAIPDMIDLRAEMPSVVDQGDIGSCTANAIAGALGYLELQQIKEKKGPEQFGSGIFDPFSRLFIYWNERAIEGSTDQDAGAQIRDGIKSLHKWGACAENNWAYCEEHLFTSPDHIAYGEAFNHKINSYLRVDNTDLDQMKHALSSGFPIVIGITVYSSFMNRHTAKTGKVPMPSYSDSVEGGHALLCVGYNDATKVFIVRNSWGDSWGDKGYCYIPFDYLTNGDLADDFWVIKR